MKSIEVKGLTKSFGDVQAVKGISFDVEEGSFFAFLGTNGAGKSTTISILCALLSKDGGEVTINGKPPEMSRKDIGVVFQESVMDSKLTVRENIRVRGSMYGMKRKDLKQRIDDVISMVGAEDFADRKYGNLSGGQRRRADIARALVHSPSILFLDEPTSGLDPQSRKHIWEIIRGLNSTGITIFLTTHYMEEAGDADDIVIINKGQIVAHDTPSMLKEKYTSDYMSVVPKDRESAESSLTNNGIQFTNTSDRIDIQLRSTVESARIMAILGDNMESVEVRGGTLDDAFIRITGEVIQ